MNNNEIKNIVLCFDKNFIIPIAVLLKSIELSNINEKFNIHIITANLPDDSKINFEKNINKDVFNLSYYHIDDSILKFCPVRPGDYINIATYFRILLPSILPENIDNVLYLDGDIIVVDNLDYIWNLNTDNFGAAVIPCIHYGNPKEFERLGLNKTEGYFNAGVMYINLKFWRENDIQQKTLKYIQDYPDRCKKHDQDALNYTLSDKLLYISTRYNFQRIFYEKDFKYSNKLSDDVEQNKFNPAIIHYCDLEKPWHKECFHPLKDVWRIIVKKLPCAKIKYTYKYKGINKLKFIIKSCIPFIKKDNIKYTIDFSELNMKLCKKFN